MRTAFWNLSQQICHVDKSVTREDQHCVQLWNGMGVLQCQVNRKTSYEKALDGDGSQPGFKLNQLKSTTKLHAIFKNKAASTTYSMELSPWKKRRLSDARDADHPQVKLIRIDKTHVPVWARVGLHT